MSTFYETDNFIVESHPEPFVSRTDGGHVRIRVKDETITDRTKLQPKQAVELMRLTMLIGESLEQGLKSRGIPIVKINYEDLGNWAFKHKGRRPFLHIHIFGRASNAIKQPFPEAVSLPDRNTGFYDGFEPLNDEDIQAILAVLKKLILEDRYSNQAWGLSR